jgi:RNA-binding protein NOB1
MFILVTEFSRKTGDYGSLSLTDLKVLALTYMLEVQHVGTAHLSENPTIRATVEITKPYKPSTTSDVVDADGKKKEDAATQMVGFVVPKHDEEDEEMDESNVRKLLNLLTINFI